MSLPYFAVFILALCLGWMQFFWTAKHHFSGLEEAKNQVKELRAEVKEERLKTQLAKDEFLEFRQDVATLMPQALPIAGKGINGYPLRNLAAVLNPSSSDAVRPVIIKTLFERGQELFRQKKFEESNRVFKMFVEKYSYSESAPSAYFLWLDGAFQTGDYRQCIEISNQMVEQFPGLELTGFALLRLGRIYELQGRAEDAVDLYKTVLRSYPQRDVAAQAKASLKGLAL
jgi:TolA-binding protein